MFFSIVVFMLFSSVCWAGGSKDKGSQQQTKTQQETTQVTTHESLLAQKSIPSSPFFTGNGGKGISLAILVPQALGLTENQSYLPTLVQGEFVSSFSSFSAISVLDRKLLDDQYAELYSGYYSDDAQGIYNLGNLAPASHILLGRITRTARGYALQMSITKSADNMTVASYSGTFTFAELDNLVGIRRASLDLLEKIGVTPTERTQTELVGGATVNHVNAQTALAQGITAQKQGTIVEAMSYFYRATAFDESLIEAANRVNEMWTLPQ